jgi:methionine sulfoxide reductase catalytic subunit
MVIPWLGFPLRDLHRPGGAAAIGAKYVRSPRCMDPQQMPGQRRNVLQWPYVEALRLDEAMHPLTIIVAGLYGQRCRTRTARRCG